MVEFHQGGSATNKSALFIFYQSNSPATVGREVHVALGPLGLEEADYAPTVELNFHM